MERLAGFEPATSTLARLHSTTELQPRYFFHLSCMSLILLLHQALNNMTTTKFIIPMATANFIMLNLNFLKNSFSHFSFGKFLFFFTGGR